MALYLVKLKDGKLSNEWSAEPEKDFNGLTVFGEALKDESGAFEPAEAIRIVNGKPEVDPVKKTQVLDDRKTQRDLEQQKKLKASQANLRIRATDLSKIKDLDVQAFLKDLRDVFFP